MYLQMQLKKLVLERGALIVVKIRKGQDVM